MLADMTSESPDIVLASTSPYRRRLLERTGVAFRVAAPTCDETPVPGVPPRDLALLLARTKAESVADSSPGAIVIGSDQLVDLDGEVLGKPGTMDVAVDQLRRMSGKAHRLWTAVVVIRGTERHEHIDCQVLTMRSLEPAEIARYVSADRPLDCAGSYKIESGGIALMERVVGDDPSAIEGLPLIATLRMLRNFGVDAP